MSAWSSWLFSGTQKETAHTTDEGENSEETKEEDTWTKGLQIAGGWMDNVSSYAASLTDTVKQQVTETTATGFLADFQKEQEKFEHKQRHERDAGVPPWVGYNEEEIIKTQVLELSSDSRNFLREPPPGVNFQFDYERLSPVAMTMLHEDPKLQKLRFELVPKKVSERSFWRNYFYRVSLIKQSVQLSTLSAAESPKSILTSTESRDQPDSSVTSPHSDTKKNEAEQEHVPPSEEDESVEEFASDQLYNSNSVSKDTVTNELDQLGVSKEDVPVVVDSNELWDELKEELEQIDLVDAGEQEITWSEEELQLMLSDNKDE